ncbi:putative glutathione peroxidase [Helianthus annuus]|nr:putative glutathione peroxidase [Helianthus annuus]
MVHPHSLLVITINGAGLFIKTVYLLLFLIYSNHKQRIKVLLIMLAEIVFVGVLSALVLTVAEIVFVGVLQQQSSMAAQPKKTLYDFTVMDAKGNDVDLSVHKGKVVLIVNVASKCGLINNNYDELNQIYLKYKEKGLH